MKKLVWTLGILAITSGMAAAQEVNELVPAPEYQPAPERSALDKALIANENKIADALMKKDKAGFTALVTADGWSIDGNGFMKTSELAGMLDQLVIKSYKISEEKVSWVDPNTAIVAYKWTGSGTFGGQPFPSTVYASTVWSKKGDKWIAVFHQETEATKPPVKK
jgi:ketosteroid isomerase-like protein